MAWLKITKENKHTLKIGEYIKFHNGYEWLTTSLTEFHLDREFIPTGVHNEVANLVYPMFGSNIYVCREENKKKTKKTNAMEKTEQSYNFVLHPDDYKWIYIGGEEKGHLIADVNFNFIAKVPSVEIAMKIVKSHQLLTEIVDALNDKSELSIWEQSILQRAKKIIKSTE